MRATGFYWVKLKGVDFWEVAQFSRFSMGQYCWYVVGQPRCLVYDGNLQDEDFDEIIETRILNPQGQ